MTNAIASRRPWYRTGPTALGAGLCFSIVAALPALGLGGQEGQEPQEGQDEAEEFIPALPPALGGGSPQDKLIELFHEVEQSLSAIDEKLLSAGAGETPLEDVADAGLDKLLRDTQSESAAVVSGIEEILRIADEMGSTSMSSCMKPDPNQRQKSQGNSPLDQQRDQGPSERERTPEGPRQDQPEDKPGGEQQKDQQQQKPGEDGDPNSPEGSRPDGQNRDGDQPPEGETDDPSAADDAERWGNLPVRFRQTFRNQLDEELPVQYRDWIDAYYRRLNRETR